ncbi:hypothetical protein SCLCIDRAFT_1220669 [Scleroderma citrinum Foug A]|uniref:Uncharacterized protein n=1 Tax=Scleroderma citrinum Foug A TaxID=1036808 RepID=A0A0C2Z2D9_9AGAM|nr:hypothetical protein SCLCIDRAFT_1220669 [Scleroderma citrinum Foug A]
MEPFSPAWLYLPLPPSFPLQLGSLRLLLVDDAQYSDAASPMHSICLSTNLNHRRSESLTAAGTILLNIIGRKRPSNAIIRQWTDAITWRLTVCPQPRHRG